MAVVELFGEEDPVRDTVTGRRLLNEGELRVLERQLRARLGEEGDPFVARLARCDSGRLDAVADLLVRRLSRRQLAEALDDLLPPGGDERS